MFFSLMFPIINFLPRSRGITKFGKLGMLGEKAKIIFKFINGVNFAFSRYPVTKHNLNLCASSSFFWLYLSWNQKIIMGMINNIHNNM